MIKSDQSVEEIIKEIIKEAKEQLADIQSKLTMANAGRNKLVFVFR